MKASRSIQKVTYRPLSYIMPYSVKIDDVSIYLLMLYFIRFSALLLLVGT